MTEVAAVTQYAAPDELENLNRPTFVWSSTDDSIRNGIPSILACFEVFFSVIIYWTIAIHFETLAPLWISICVAPLLLMRSHESIALGIKWYSEFWRMADDLEDASIKVILALTSFWLGVVSGVFVFILSFIFLRRGLISRLNDWTSFAALGMDIFVSFILGYSAFVAACPAADHLGRSRGVLLHSFTHVGRIFGAFFRAGAIRFAATARHALQGFWAIPHNFRHALFVTDIRQPAELVPGYKSESILSRSDELNDYLSRNAPPSVRWLSGLILFSVLFVPAYVYRLSIKSTCWLYLPLVYIAGERDLAFSRAHFLDRLARSPWERGRRLLALFVAAGFILTILAFNLTKLPDLLSLKIMSPIEFLFYLDFPWKKPWQIFNIVSASITLYLWTEVKATLIDLRYAIDEKSNALVESKIQWLKFLVRVRDVSSVILIAILLVHVLFVFDALGIQSWIPTYVWRGLYLLYGDYIPAPHI